MAVIGTPVIPQPSSELFEVAGTPTTDACQSESHNIEMRSFMVLEYYNDDTDAIVTVEMPTPACNNPHTLEELCELAELTLGPAINDLRLTRYSEVLRAGMGS